MPSGGLDKSFTSPFYSAGVAESVGEIALIAAAAPGPPPVTIGSNFASLMFRPGRGPGRFLRPQARYGSVFPTTIIPARGPTTAALLLFDYEDGGSVVYSWRTDILRSRSGLERRMALNMCPRETYAFTVTLHDGDINYLQSQLVANAAQGKPFAVALSHESIQLSASNSGIIVNVPSTALLDWCYPGQTVAVLAMDASSATGVIQSSTATTITLDTPVGAAGQAYARIMPTVPCYLEETQGFSHYAVTLTRFELKARAIYFGNASSAWAPLGATVTTYTDPLSLVSYPVWDRGLDNDETLPRSLLSGIEIIDTGGALTMVAPQTYSDFAREVAFHMKSDADRQFFKAFMGATRGRQLAFLLPTWRLDLVPVSPAISGSVLAVRGNTRGYTDYANQWLGSLAQRHLQVVFTNGTVNYITVSDAHDNLDGTENLQLDRSLTGTIASVSFLEVCRFDSDDFAVSYANGLGYVKVPAMVVQQ